MRQTLKAAFLSLIISIICTYSAYSQISQLYPVKKDGKWGYIDNKGTVVIDINYEIAFPFNDELAMVIKQDKKIFIDNMGNTILKVPENFQVHTKFSHGLLGFVSDLGGGFLSETGELVILNDYTEVRPFSNGYAVIREAGTGLYGAIDKSGNQKLLPQFTFLSDFENGYAMFRLPDSHHYGLVDKYGKIFIINRYPYICLPNDNLIGLWNGSMYVEYVDMEQNGVFKSQAFASPDLPSQFALPLHKFVNGYVKYYDPFKNKFGFKNKKGEVEIPAQFDDASDLNEGLIAVKQGTKWGYCNKKGVMVIRAQYDFADDFNSGIAAVFQGGTKEEFLDSKPGVKMGYVDKKGEFVWQLSQ